MTTGFMQVVMRVSLLAGAFSAFADALPAALTVPPFPPITDGLILDLDAGDPSTMTLDAAGGIVNWKSKVGTMEFGSPRTDGVFLPGRYDATLFGNRGAAVAGWSAAGTKTNTCFFAKEVQGEPARTHMIVWQFLKEVGQDPGYTYGYANGETASGREGFEWTCMYASNPVILKNPGEDVKVFEGDCPGDVPTLNRPKMRYNVPYTFSYYPSEATATSDNRTKNYRQVIGSWHFDYDGRSMPVAYAEVMNWNRVLSEPERRYMQCYLTAKWHPQYAVYEWTGASDGETFDDGANWKGGEAPMAGGIAYVSASSAALKVTADATVDYLLLDGVSSVSVQSGAALSVANLLSVRGTTVFNIAAGARFAHGYVHKWPSASVAFALDRGTLEIATPSAGQRMAGNEYGKTFPLSCQPNELQAGPVTGTGRLVVACAGVYRLSPDYAVASGLAWTVASGWLDMNGKSISLATLEGTGAVTNSASARAILTVDSAASPHVSPQLLAGVDVAVKGGGTGTLEGGQGSFDGTLSVKRSSLNVRESLRPEIDIGGVTWHIDASQADTIQTDADGRVTRMLSCSPERMVFGKEGSNQLPLYSATGFNGKPALMFATDKNGAQDKSVTTIQGDVVSENNTIAIVFKPFAQPKMPIAAQHHIVAPGNHRDFKDNGPLSSYMTYGIGYSQSDAKTVVSQCYRAENYEATRLRICHNGAFLRDDDADVKQAVTNLPETAQVLIAAVLDFTKDTSYTARFNPALGANIYNYAFGGAIAEAIGFDRALTRAEMARLSAYLMRKWGVDRYPVEDADVELPDAKDQLPVNGTLAVDGAAVDLGGFTNHVAKFMTEGANSTLSNGTLIPAELEVKVTENGQFAKVSGDADWDVSGTALKFAGFEPKNGKIIQTSGTVEGSFASFDPAKMAGKVKSDGQTVKVSGSGLMLILR